MWGKDEMTCPHHWDITPVSGPTSHGVCKLCGEERDFNNHLTIDDTPSGKYRKEKRIREEKMSIEEMARDKLREVLAKGKPQVSVCTGVDEQVCLPLVKRVRKMTDKELESTIEHTRANPWEVHAYMLEHKDEIMETYENESHSIAATAKVWYLPVNTVRGNLIAWGVHKPAVKAEVQQSTGEVPGKSLGKSKTTMSYLWAGEEPRPCDQPCPMCGSCDISGKFTKRKQVLHTCQWCWYEWRTEPLKEG